MSRVIYRGIELQIIKTSSYSRSPVLSDDGADVLYVRHHLSVSAIYNPKATAYTDEDDDGNPSADNTALPAWTDKAIRHRLMQKGGLLLYYVGPDDPLVSTTEDFLLLMSPASKDGSVNNYFTVDAANGPKPLSCDVVQIAGTKTFQVQFAIETFLVECPGNPATRNPILSHRWTMTEDIDEQFLSVREINGTAVFRSDLLDDQQVVADQFRSQLVHQIPPRFQREKVSVTAHSSGLMLTYRVVDRQKYQSLGFDSAAIKVQATHTAAVRLGAANSGAGIARTVDVKVWGDDTSPRIELYNLAVRIAAKRLPEAGHGAITEAQIMEDLMNPFVHYRSVILDRPGSNATPAQPIDISGYNFFLSQLTDDISALETGNPPPPQDGGTRGTWIANLAAAALASPCGGPSGVPDDAGVAGDSEEPFEPEDPPEVITSVTTSLPEEPLDNISEEARDSIYTDYQIDIYYYTKSGRVAMPVAADEDDEDADDVAIVTLSRPRTFVRKHWTAERLIEFPVAPHPISNDPNEVYLANKTRFAAPQMIPTGTTYVCRIGGTYHYALKRGPRPGQDNLPTATLPTDTAFFEENIFPAENFVHGLIDAEGGQVG